MSKGQIMSQVFILILGAAVFIMILLFGYQAMNMFQEKQRQICLLGMTNDIQSAVKRIAIASGNTDILKIADCGGFSEICFVDVNNIDKFKKSAESDIKGSKGKKHNFIFNLAESKTQNVFLMPPADFPFFVPDMSVKNGGFCEDFSGQLTLNLEGFGNRAEISAS